MQINYSILFYPHPQSSINWLILWRFNGSSCCTSIFLFQSVSFTRVNWFIWINSMFLSIFWFWVYSFSLIIFISTLTKGSIRIAIVLQDQSGASLTHQIRERLRVRRDTHWNDNRVHDPQALDSMHSQPLITTARGSQDIQSQIRLNSGRHEENLYIGTRGGAIAGRTSLMELQTLPFPRRRCWMNLPTGRSFTTLILISVRYQRP